MVKNVWTWLLVFLTRLGLSLRYRIKIQGFDKLKLDKKGGILFLPNHPAEIDPVILTLLLWNPFKAHPLVVEQFYRLKGAHYFQKLVGAVPIPDLGGVVNSWKQKQVEKCLKGIAQGLKSGSSYMIYPSGRLKVTAEEVIGGSSFVYTLVQECPDANIVLVRTTGLWGSRFSKALTGVTPDFGKTALQGILLVLKNFLFFAPRREVLVEVESYTPVKGEKLEFNQALEKWYNQKGPEPLKLVSDCFWKESYPAITAEKKTVTAQSFTISEDVENEILTKIAEIAKKEAVKREENLAKDLGLDSLDLADLQTFLIVRYEITSLNPAEIHTVEDVLRVVAHPPLPDKGHKKKAKGWPHEKNRPSVMPPDGSTIPEAFLRNCDRMKHHIACADERMGALSYKKLKLIILTLSDHFQTFEEKQIGVLLPSTTITYAVVLALQLAGKIPVMLNWTVGSRALSHCKKMAGFTKVISSRRFLEQLADGDLGEVDDLLLYMEDIRSEITLFSKIKGILGHYRKADFHLKNVSKDDPAVILFTSGTETLPKGVPLSHANLLSNQASALSCVELTSADIFYGALPPFHSFGFSVTGILPLLVGLKVYYAPDPTQYYAMAHDIHQWHVTLLCSAPSFIQGLFKAAKKDQLKSLRMVVGGAEKVSENLFKEAEKIGALMLEGYGITECSPIVTLTRPGEPREGVGTPIPGVELCIIQDGEICIHGPNVFSGYLDQSNNPFIELNGKKWYRSGDIGQISPSGALILSGRLKRFVKIGGEMVSLSSVEEELIRAVKAKGVKIPEKEGPILAVASKENGEKALLVAFTTFEVSKDLLNDALRESGFGRIIKIAEVRVLDAIPITGTGKVHFRALQDIL